MVFRLLTIGLCGACVVLLATFEPVRLVHMQPASARPARCDRAPPLSVVDVAADVAPGSIPPLLRLGSGEWVSAVNDQVPDDLFQADQLIAAFARHGSFLDVTVARGTTERRVLLLIH